MRVLITSAAALLLAAAAATALALHAPPRPAVPRAPVPSAMPVATDAVPGLVWRNGTATLRLTDRPCPADDLKVALEMEGVSMARAYEVTQGSKRFTGCWAKDVAGDVVTLEAGREIGQIPIGWFRTGG